jgi:hypothetical protein
MRDLQAAASGGSFVPLQAIRGAARDATEPVRLSAPVLQSAHRRRYDIGCAVVETAGVGAADGSSVLTSYRIPKSEFHTRVKFGFRYRVADPK